MAPSDAVSTAQPVKQWTMDRSTTPIPDHFDVNISYRSIVQSRQQDTTCFMCNELATQVLKNVFGKGQYPSSMVSTVKTSSKKSGDRRRKSESKRRPTTRISSVKGTASVSSSKPVVNAVLPEATKTPLLIGQKVYAVRKGHQRGIFNWYVTIACISVKPLTLGVDYKG